MYRFILISTFTLYLLILSAQAGNYSATSIVLSGDEVSAIDEQVKPKASELSSSTLEEGVVAASVNSTLNKLNNWKISARPLFNATKDALKNILLTPRILLFVAPTLNGGYGIEVGKFAADKDYGITIVVVPRYKNDVLRKEELDDVWEKHLESVTEIKKPKNIIVKDFRKTLESQVATEAINAYREELMKNHGLIETRNVSGRVAYHTYVESKKVETLKEKLDALLLEEVKAFKRFLETLDLDLGECVAIDSIVAAGYETMEETLDKHIIRHPLAEEIGQLFNKIQRSGGVTGSYDPPCNTTTEYGYFHVSKFDEMTVNLIPNSHIPDFMVLITYPREEVMALEAADPTTDVSAVTENVVYQYRKTKMYLTVYVDKNHSERKPMSTYINEKKRDLKFFEAQNVEAQNVEAQYKEYDTTFNTFINQLEAAETEYRDNDNSINGFLHLCLPKPVAASVAYIPGIAKLTKETQPFFELTILKATTVTERMDFVKYASMIAKKGNRLTKL